MLRRLSGIEGCVWYVQRCELEDKEELEFKVVSLCTSVVPLGCAKCHVVVTIDSLGRCVLLLLASLASDDCVTPAMVKGFAKTSGIDYGRWSCFHTLSQTPRYPVVHFGLDQLRLLDSRVGSGNS